MGTKNQPGAHDCYEKAEPDEPMFILLARDPLAPVLVALWAGLAESFEHSSVKAAEASKCAASMIEWYADHDGMAHG